MPEVVFGIPITGTIRIEGDSLTITVSETKITMKLDMQHEVRGKLTLERGKTLHDIVLATARAFVEETGTDEFTAAELLHLAREKHPELNLKRNSWGSHVISCAPNHPSHHHYTSRRRYFRYLGKGRYSLDQSLLSANSPLGTT